ncbi:type-1 angiotensin II receptor-associated protein-like [Saccoglossus kowalevskii]|uniref:Type-1 angiotensin II receptor-associated protein-like n=1 Tax=Saccoglossus kowalevskii TaxID=10224 RepID=A0ABM0GXB2_SACKO|nr:PREDICTED: type-1 angiotensin II receptor-associated protein-like [Saccoglossus kowalevskii]
MAGCSCNVPLWPFILAHLWLSVWGFQAALGGQWITHSYAWMNFSIVALGCWTVGQEKMKENCLMLVISLIIGFIFDIVFIAVYNNNNYWNCGKSGYVACGNSRSEYIWSYVMAIINCILKIVTLIFAICEYKKRGGKTPNVKASVSVS